MNDHMNECVLQHFLGTPVCPKDKPEHTEESEATNSNTSKVAQEITILKLLLIHFMTESNLHKPLLIFKRESKLCFIKQDSNNSLLAKIGKQGNGCCNLSS